MRRLCASLPVHVSALAELLTSELVNNAVMHGRGAVELTASVTGGVVRVDVFDESPEQPRLPAAHEEAPGRGLAFVDEFALDWGSMVCSDRTGKQVWFTLSTS